MGTENRVEGKYIFSREIVHRDCSERHGQTYAPSTLLSIFIPYPRFQCERSLPLTTNRWSSYVGTRFTASWKSVQDAPFSTSVVLMRPRRGIPRKQREDHFQQFEWYRHQALGIELLASHRLTNKGRIHRQPDTVLSLTRLTFNPRFSSCAQQKPRESSTRSVRPARLVSGRLMMLSLSSWLSLSNTSVLLYPSFSLNATDSAHVYGCHREFAQPGPKTSFVGHPCT